MEPISLELRITQQDERTACDLLAELAGLPKLRIKHAIACGAVWIQRSRQKKQRVRRAKQPVRRGDRLWLYYHPDILSLCAPNSECIKDFTKYSIWYKPPGVMAQGTLFGDHCSILRQVEKHFRSKRQVYLVHRIDREAAGLMVLAHNSEAAARLSTLFKNRRIEKHYRITVLGDLSARTHKGCIDLPLDGKPAVTAFELRCYDGDRNQSIVDVQLKSGRRHQIRRHFDAIGFPVIGDPRYGKTNKNNQGLRLVAHALSFICPFSGIRIEASIDPDKGAP